MRIFLLCVFICSVNAGVTDKKMPIMPNIGPLTAYGHPSTRYKSIDRNIKKTISASKDSNKIDSMPDEEMNDSDPDPFVSQRKIKLLVVPDAYAAAPIQIKSHGVFETSTEKIVVAEKLPLNLASELVQDSLETFSTPTNAPSSTNTHQEKITSESTAPIEIPSTKTKLVSTESSSLSPTTKTNVPKIPLAAVAVAEKLPISQTSESNKDSLKTFPATIISSSPTEIPTLTHHEITSESVSAVPITVPSTTTTTSKSTESSHLSPTTKISVPKIPSKTITTAQKLPIIQTSESESLITNTNNDLPKNTETNETSAELLNKETFNEEGSDYDNDVFARLKDDVELIGDNPRSALSESIPRPTLSNKFLHRLFAVPSEAEADETEITEEIIPEVAFPLPNCYRTAGGFLCCNRVLEELIYRSNSVIERKRLSECNIHAFAAHLQQEAEKMFKTTFEIVIGTGDFASKSRFKDNLICKTITNKKVILIYGTPEPYSLTSSNTPLAFT
uniref:Ground-like domain-containing protein n=1 Tax=Panagrolaimus davidi TaxID=227884 RepID=A0A914NZ62_9BILA